MSEDFKNKILKKCNYHTTIAYILCDIAFSNVNEADSLLPKIGKNFAKEEKQRFSEAVKLVKALKWKLADITKPVYQINEADDVCNDSDYLSDVIEAVIARTDDTTESKTAMLEYIKKLPQVEQVEI